MEFPGYASLMEVGTATVRARCTCGWDSDPALLSERPYVRRELGRHEAEAGHGQAYIPRPRDGRPVLIVLRGGGGEDDPVRPIRGGRGRR